MNVQLENKNYTLLVDYQKEVKYRQAFNYLIKSVFDFSFEDWYLAGYWNENYIPYTLFVKERAISNVSVNIMDLTVLGEKKRYIQIGTVLTDLEFRGKGLSRYLMQKVLNDWGSKCDLIYLFANHTVLDMYPKFGFKKVFEHEYFKVVDGQKCNGNVRNLDMTEQTNRNKLYQHIKTSIPSGKISMNKNADLVMFYCTSFLKDNVYFIETLDLMVIATYDKNKLCIWDIFGRTKVELGNIISLLANPQVTEIKLGFTPNDTSSFETRKVKGDDTLFIQQGKTQLFEDNQVMFPMLSHA